MASNPDFKKVVLKNVEFIWPRLDQTYRYNNAEKRTEPCAAAVSGAGYSVGVKLPMEQAKSLKAELLAHYAECAARNAKLPKETQTVFGAKVLTDADGKQTDFVSFTAKKKAMSNAGDANKPPRVVGADLQELDDKAIWSGSTGHIRMLAYPTVDPDGMGGISLMLDAVQVLEPVYGGDSLEDDFGPAQTVDPFGDDEAGGAAPQTAQAAPSDNSAIPANAAF